MRNLTKRPISALRGAGFNTIALLFLVAVLLPVGPVKSQAPGRADDIGKKLEKLTEEVEDLKGKLKKLKDDKSAESLITLGGVELKLGGKAEFNFLDSGNDFSMQDLGADFIPEHEDPHMELQRLRLAPVFDLNRWVKIQS